MKDNARPFAARATQETIRELKWELPDQPPYSPDLAPNDFYLLGPHRSVKSFSPAMVRLKMRHGFGYDSSRRSFTQLVFLEVCKAMGQVYYF